MKDSSQQEDPRTASAVVERGPPVVKHTVADLFLLSHSNRLFLTYHVMSAGSSALNAAGVVLGGGLYGASALLFPGRLAATTASTSALAFMGTTGLVAGCAGAMLGIGKIIKVATTMQQQRQGETDVAAPAKSTPPWNDIGIQQRVDALQRNFTVRVMDVSVWSGMGLVAGLLLYAGGPSNLKLSSGTLGVMQALSLGSAVGALGGLSCVYSTKKRQTTL
jgi:hypothetical protein